MSHHPFRTLPNAMSDERLLSHDVDSAFVGDETSELDPGENFSGRLCSTLENKVRTITGTLIVRTMTGTWVDLTALALLCRNNSDTTPE